MAAEKALLLGEGDPAEYLTKGYNVVNLRTGKMRYETQAKVKICRLSCAYRNGTFFSADEEGKFESEGEALVSKETLLLFDVEFVKKYEMVKKENNSS